MGYRVPLDAATAVEQGGKQGWAAEQAPSTRAANFPGWTAAPEGELEARPSKLPGAGQGLFARVALPPGAVLPPYRGAMLTYSEVEAQMSTPELGSEYVWCPSGPPGPSPGAAGAAASPGEELSFCVDAKRSVDSNPARFVNAASSAAQCALVNTEICEIGRIMYLRTTSRVPAGAELVTNYGRLYWPGFGGC